MAKEEGSSGQVPPQPTIRRVFGMMKANLDEFERQTLNGFKTLREQYQEKDDEMSRAISTAMDSYDKNSTPAERRIVEEKLQSLLSHRSSFRAEHNQREEEEACEKRQMELLRPLQIALFHSFPIGSWDGMMLHGAQKVQEETDHKEQQHDEEIQHTVEEVQDEFETVNGAVINEGAPPEGGNGGIHNEEPLDEVLDQIPDNEVAEWNKVWAYALSDRINEIDRETSDQSSREPEDSGRGFCDLDSEFEPGIEEDSEEDGDESSYSVKVDEEVVVPGSKRKLPYASRSQPRKKPCQWEKSPTKNQSKERTVCFKEVYENTRAGRKEIIVQFPAKNGQWYIIRCEEHGVEFGGSNPLMDAAFHLGSLKHNKYSKAYKDVIEKMGIRVKYCTASRAEQNNNAFTNKAVQKDSPESTDRATANNDERNSEGPVLGSQQEALMSGRAEASRGSREMEDPFYDDLGPKASHCDDVNERNEKSYVRRQPGDICLVYHSGEYIPVLVLPFDNMLEIGINGDLKTLDLVQCMPDCCIYNQTTSKCEWKDGYEDGGRLESSRVHPSLCLTHNALEMCPPLWVKGSNLGDFDLTDPIIVKQKYYQPLLRLILQVHNNRKANKADVATDSGNQHPSSSGNSTDGADGESCASPRADGRETQPDNVFKEGDEVEDSPEDGRPTQTDRGENQEDDSLISEGENVQNDGPSGSSGMSSLGLQQDGNQVSKPQQGIEASVDHSPGSEESHSLSQQPALNRTSALFDDSTIKDSSTNCTTMVPKEVIVRGSYMSYAESGDKLIVMPSTEKRSQSPPPTIVRAVSIQTISSDSDGESEQPVKEVSHGNPEVLAKDTTGANSHGFGHLPENKAAFDQPCLQRLSTSVERLPTPNSSTPDQTPESRIVPTTKGVPAQQELEHDHAVYKSPSVGTQYAWPAIGNVEGPQQLANGSWPSICLTNVITPPKNSSSTTTQTQFIDSTTSPVGTCSCSTLDTSNQSPMQGHQVGEIRGSRAMWKETANDIPKGPSHSQGCQPQSQVPSQARAEAQMQHQTQTRFYAPLQPKPPLSASQPRIRSDFHVLTPQMEYNLHLNSQFRNQSQSQPGIQFQAHNQPRRAMSAQCYPQPQYHLQPHFPNQIHPGPQNLLQSSIQTQLLPEPQSQMHSQSPTQSFSPVPPQPQGVSTPWPQGAPQPQGLPRTLQGLHVSSGVGVQTQTQPQIQPQSQAWTQSPTTAVPRSSTHPVIRPRARRTPIIQLRPAQSRQTQGRSQISPLSSARSPTPTAGEQVSPVLLTPGSGPYISPPFSASSTSPTAPAMGGLSSPEDVRELLGPPKQTPLPFMYVNPPVNPAAQVESEAERVLQKHWPMFPRGPLRDYLDAYVRMNHRAPGIEGLRLVGGRSIYFCPFCLSSTAQWASGLELINHLDSMHRTGQFRPLNTR